MPRLHRNTWTAALLIAAVTAAIASAPSQARADAAAALVSPDAEAAIIVRSPAAVSRQIAQLRQTLNLPADELDDLLGQLKHHAGMAVGMDDRGTLVLAMLGRGEADGQPTWVMLVPVTNHDAFIENLGGDPADDVASLTLSTGQRAFGRLIGDHVAMSHSRSAVQDYRLRDDADPLGAGAGAMGLQYLADADVAVVLDLEALQPTIERWLEQLDEQFDMLAGLGVGGAMVDQGRAALKMYRRAAATLAESSRTLVLAIELTDEGLGLTATMGLEPDAPLRAYFPGQPSRAADELARLPDRPYLLAVAVDERALAFGRLAKAAMEAMDDEQQAMLGPAYRQSLDLLDQTEAVAAAWYAPERRIGGGGLLNAITLYRVADAGRYLADNRQLLEALDGQSITSAAGEVTFHSSYVENALQIDGTRVDQYQVRVEPDDAGRGFGAGNAGAATSYNGYIAAAGNHVAVTTITDPQAIRNALRSVEQGAGIGAGGAIANLRDLALPPNVALEAYVSLHDILPSGDQRGGRRGAALAEAPPVAIGIGVQDDGVALRIYLPIEAIPALPTMRGGGRDHRR